MNRLWRRHLVLPCCVAAAVALDCGGSGSAPTLPTTESVQISATLTPSPMMTRSQDGSSAPGSRYQIAAEVRFRASTTFSGRVTSIDLTILSASGEGGRGTVALD